jgi:hypothetical protein
MEQWTLTDEQKACLRDQCISDDQPGTVLHDFQVLLDFLGRDGVARKQAQRLTLRHRKVCIWTDSGGNSTCLASWISSAS